MDSTPQFNSSQLSQNAVNRVGGPNQAQNQTGGQGSRGRPAGPLAQIKEVNEVKPFSYNIEQQLAPNYSRPGRTDNDQMQNFGKLKDDFNKIDMLQQAI